MADQFRFISSHVDTGKIEYRRESLYTSHKLGTFDVILMLGLFYHLRHPHLFLDYCSNLNRGGANSFFRPNISLEITRYYAIAQKVSFIRSMTTKRMAILFFS